MCGIIGISGALPPKANVARARDVIRHRGPDDAGLYYDEGQDIALGSRRLSIIDLSSAGHQPMHSVDGRFVIAFNGEIYNYIEVREELKKTYAFKTKTDTEVLLAAYATWGADCLKKMNGMFAFAIWDNKKQVLFCARDRVGEKPFYYHYDPAKNRFYFASEIKALLALGVRRDPNEKAIYEYLYYGFYHHSEETFFRHIQELRGGHYLVKKGKTISIKQYWDLANIGEGVKEIKEKDAQRKFKELLADSIKLRFRSDVPVGINLSSGLDSNTLLHYAKTITGKDVETFSMCLPTKVHNECALIEPILNPQQRKRWHTAYLRPQEVFTLAEKMNAMQDQPYGGMPTIMYTTINAKAKHEGVTVLLEGQGVDEILAGYKYYTVEHQKDAEETRGKRRGVAASSADFSQDMSQLLNRDILHQNFTRAYKKNGLDFKAPFASHLLNAQYRDIVYTKLPRVLHFNDHVSMAYSRELRLPFLDHRLIEFCFFLPARFKIRGDQQKVLVRDVMKTILPPAVSRTQKVAFGAMQSDWLRDYFKKQVYGFLDATSFKERPYWDHKKLKAKVDAFYKGEGNNSFFIWQFINLELWFKKFIDS